MEKKYNRNKIEKNPQSEQQPTIQFRITLKKIFRSVRITHAGSSSYIVLRFCPKFAQMENSTTITKSDWLFAHHPIPNAKFQPITL